jgi:hypothetical protein
MRFVVPDDKLNRFAAGYRQPLLFLVTLWDLTTVRAEC